MFEAAATNLAQSLLYIFWGSVIALTIAILISYRDIDVKKASSDQKTIVDKKKQE